jgi:hypothetical protein
VLHRHRLITIRFTVGRLSASQMQTLFCRQKAMCSRVYNSHCWHHGARPGTPVAVDALRGWPVYVALYCQRSLRWEHYMH